MKRLDFNQLATFVAIVDASSITKAAASLHRTQAAISIQLKKLEEGTGKQLLNRSYNQFTLTREGEILLSYARRILKLSEEAFNAISDEDITGIVRFGIPDGYARAFIQNVLREFMHRFPQIRIQIKNDDSHNLYKSLHLGDLDLILVTRDLKESGGELIRREKVCWVAAKDYQFDINQPIPLALYEQGCAYRKNMVEKLNQVGKDWFVSFECQGVTGFDIAISNGLAISASAESLVKDEWRIIKASEGLPDLGNIEVELHRIPGEGSEAIRCFADELTRQISNIHIGEAH
ncbi:LysR substrate-binding domain-containing protein [Amphritea sp. 1_MG-2023]|uniref:LysR substrate-binding domain-containing protein n=1 Tax=Amphritea sp. 1_MG-2023 TaxID=3062670 RepID=UPI0026E24F33|nr:LysR substrate-binding domain-containing protein [Amphritea sp. 1_MG-2023]MDO6563548.1 LysR substrate-binding domain-containing protein [Amphritea sp. 1_MG-2023]